MPNNSNPLVSVIIPVWNPGPGISRCIESLQNQTLKEIEDAAENIGFHIPLFEEVLKLYVKHPEIPKALKRVIGKTIEVNSVEDIHKAFEEDINNPSAKTVIKWNL